MSTVEQSRQFVQRSSADAALVVALERRDMAGLHRALLNGADVERILGPTGWLPLHKACADGWHAGVEFLLAWGHQFSWSGTNQPWLNTLCLAAPSGLVLVELLIRTCSLQIASKPTLAALVRERLPEEERTLWDLRWQPT